jgi:hypothetical protein
MDNDHTYEANADQHVCLPGAAATAAATGAAAAAAAAALYFRVLTVGPLPSTLCIKLHYAGPETSK